MSFRLLALLCLYIAALAAPVRAQVTLTRLEDGEAALPGTWTTAGGCAARTGRSLSSPVLDDPVAAWRAGVPGVIEGEPLVWEGKVIVTARQARGRRAILIYDLETGQALLNKSLPASLPLEPSIWGDRICVRPESTRVDLYRIRGPRLLALRSIRAKLSISPPLLYGDELYVRVDGDLVRHDIDEREPVWTTSVSGKFRGRPSLRGNSVYALRYDRDGQAFVTRLRRTDGGVMGSIEAGHHGGEVPDDDLPARLHVFDEDIFVHYPLPVPATNGGRLTFGRLDRGQKHSATGSSLHPFLTAPVPLEDGWVALEEDAGEPRWVSASREGERLRLLILSNSENHPELLQSSSPATIAEDMLYLGGLAARLEDYRVAWKVPVTPVMRPVPVDDTLLVVEGPSTLVALRTPTPGLTEAEEIVAEFEAKLEVRLASGFADLARKAMRVGDRALTERWITEAVRRGARGPSIEAAQDGLERLLARGRSVRPDPRRVQTLLAEEYRLLAMPRAELYKEIRSSEGEELKRAYIRALLAHDPNHSGAHGLVRAMIPRGAPITSPFDPLAWLDFLEVHAETPVTFLEPQKGRVAEGEAETLQREARRWRTDVDGYRSDRLFVVAAPGRPGAVARCLEVGELVCDLLDELFGAEISDDGWSPLTLLLYDTPQEYMEQSTSVGSGPEAALGWTAGHYSQSENLSRMFVPEDDQELKQLMGVYAHELTHHWLATYAPFAQEIPSAEQPGYWIAEGFATLIEEFKYDPAAGTWEAENPRAESLDTVANATAEQLLPWETFFALTYQDFEQLSPHADSSLPLTWRLGVRAEKSEMQMFYAQAGAASHYLFQLSEESRGDLLDYLAAWYEGDSVRTDVFFRFRQSPQELGQQIEAFARDAVNR